MYTYTKEDLAFLKNRKAEQKVSTSSAHGLTAAVSGATSGVGLEAAKALVSGGATLLIIARNPEKAERVRSTLQQAGNPTIEVFICDFNCFAAVYEVAAAIIRQHPVIDLLINSAGMHSTTRRLSEDGNELVFQVNHLSPFLLTWLLLPALKAAPQGRIIQVNSEGHRFGGLRLDDLDWSRRFYIGLRAYGASKTAQLMTVIKWSRLLAGSRVTINAMHPGGVRTNIGRNNGFLYRLWLNLVVKPHLKDPGISGSALYYLATAPELSRVSGRYFNLTVPEKPMPHVLDEEIISEIWQTSMIMTGLHPGESC